MDDKGNLYRTNGVSSMDHLVPKGHKELTEREYNILQHVPAQERQATLAWLRYEESRPNLKGIEKVKCKQGFLAGWRAHDEHINAE